MFLKRVIEVNYFVFIVLLLSSCKLFTTTNPLPEVKVIFPSPPDTARIQFLKSIASSESVTGGQSKFKTFVFGKEELQLIMKPSGVFMKNGKIYVCDIGVKAIEIIDLERGRFDIFNPGGKGELKLPLGCFVDENERLYVADGNRHQIVVFDQNGAYLSSFGDSANFRPTSVFVSGGKIWVSNVKDHAIHVYNQNTYALIRKFPDGDEGTPGFLNQPTSVFVTDDKIYVSDFGDFRIKTYNHNYEFIESIGSYGKMPGQFARPKHIAVDSNGFLYVVDAAFENVQIFNKNGELMMPFGGPYTGPGYMSLPIGITIDYEGTHYFEKYVDPDYELKYLILVTNQYGPDKLNIYGRVEPKVKQ
jgi:outer membrane protein assembly factor BamB